MEVVERSKFPDLFSCGLFSGYNKVDGKNNLLFSTKKKTDQKVDDKKKILRKTSNTAAHQNPRVH